MKKQFLHEHHNRNEKSGKPDYRMKMCEGRSNTSPIPIDKLVHKAQARREVELEEQLIEQLADGVISVGGITGRITRTGLRAALKGKAMEQFRRYRFFYGSYIIRRGWAVSHFAKSNQLEPTAPSTEDLFLKLNESLERDLVRIGEQIQVRYKPGPGHSITPFLECDEHGLECKGFGR